MEERDEDHRDQGDLLGGAHSSGRNHYEVGDRWGCQIPPCGPQRDSMRELGQVERGETPPHAHRGSLSTLVCQGFKGRTGALREDQTMAGRGRGAMDEDLGRSGQSRRRRIGRAQGQGRANRACGQGSRRGGSPGAEELRVQSEVEKEKEKEEEGEEGKVREQEKGEGHEVLGGALRRYGFGPGPGGQKEDYEEGQEDCKEEKPKEQFFQSDIKYFEGGQQRGGFRTGDLWAGGPSADYLDEGPRSPQHGGPRAYAKGFGAPIRSALGPGSVQPSTSIYPILEDGVGWEGHQAIISRVANAGLCGGPSPPRQSCFSSGCGNPENEKSRTDCRRWGLQGSSTPRTMPSRTAVNVLHDRDSRSLSSTTGGAQSKGGSRQQELGKERRKRRPRLLGGKRKREEGRFLQGQRKRKERRQERRAKRGGQGEEVTEGLSAKKAEISGREKVSPGTSGQEVLRRQVNSLVPPLLTEEDVNSKLVPNSTSAGTEMGHAGGFTSKSTISTSRLLAEDKRLLGGDGFSMEEEFSLPMRGDLREAEDSLGRPGSLRQLMQQGLKGLKLIDLMDVLVSVFDESLRESQIKHSKIQRSGGVFPLPESHEGLQSCLQSVKGPSTTCVLAMCRALNSYYGIEPNDQTPVTLAKKAAVRSLSRYADDIGGWEEKFDGLDWGHLLSTRSIDYKGDEVRVSRQFCWDNLVSALPDEVGRIPLVEVCDLGTLDYISHFEEYLLPSEAQVYTKPPRVMVEDHHWEQVCSGLLEKGICDLLPVSELYHVQKKCFCVILCLGEYVEWIHCLST